MPIDKNDLSVDSNNLNSQIQADDFQNRIYTNALSTRLNLKQKIANYKSNHAAVGNIRFPSDVGKYYMVLQIDEYNRRDLFTLNFSAKERIILPLPNSLVDSDAVSYEMAELGIGAGAITDVVGRTVVDGIKKIADSGNTLEESKNQLNELGKNLLRDGGELLGGIVGGNLAEAASRSSVLSATIKSAQALSGYVPNQFFTILLEGPTYKKYNFTWRLLPKNRDESETIKNIILKIQNAKAVRKSAAGLLWGFPKIFKLAFYPNSQFLFKFKPSVMTAISIDYSPGGPPAFYASRNDQRSVNAPEAIVISASFMEMEYWLDGDYTDSNDPNNSSPGR